MYQYKNAKWAQFRAEIIELDEGRCSVCGRSKGDGVVLQVHHKKYISGRRPWEYAYDDCVTICKGCHAREHGIIHPSKGWTLYDKHDLGDLDGECDVCGTAIRYVFTITHPSWPTLEVGTVCCDRMTDTDIASNFKSGVERSQRRFQTFLSSSRWRLNSDGSWSIKKSRVSAMVVPRGRNYKLWISGQMGNREFDSEYSAKKYLFMLFDTGEIIKFEDELRKRTEI